MKQKRSQYFIHSNEKHFDFNVLKILLLFIMIAVPFSNKAAIINGYAKVTNINGAKTALQLSNVNQSFDNFDVGDKIIIIQMQDNVIGSDTNNTSSFGNINNISNSGVYEFATIASLNVVSGTLISITLVAPITNNFNINSNSSVQIVTFKHLGFNYTTTSSIEGLAWNGSVGGIIAFEVENTLTINHNISANAIGFRGGSRSLNGWDGSSTCLGSVFKTNNVNWNGYKGEGIYSTTTSTLLSGRGKIANGGGGGGFINCGGGGGGNYTAGGRAGMGWSCNNSTSAHGIGGAGLSAYISSNRIFLGGGGGGGHQNDNSGTNGGNGGGIILIKAKTINSSISNPSGVNISANGGTAANSGNDGAGGGGGGGSILFQVTNYSFTTSCPLVINANGGNGGNCTSSPHSGGGGGGQGVIYFNSTRPTTNISSFTINGLAGTDSNGGSVIGASGDGVNNSGIIINFANPLPIVLLSFDAVLNNEKNIVDLKWSTASQENNDYFTIERSTDTKEWNEISTIEGAGTINHLMNYTSIDEHPEPAINYYRLKQTDFNGDFTYSKIIAINNKSNLENSIFLYPNPVKDELNIVTTLSNIESISILNAVGAIVKTENYNEDSVNKMLDLTNFPSGNYLINIIGKSFSISKKIVLQH